MAKKTVLIIDESPQFCDYVATKLEAFELVVIKAVNGVDGMGKLLHHRPDLVIADYFLSQRDLVSILKAKNGDVTVAATPVIVCTSRISREKLVELTQLGVRKIFMKPLKIDQLWQAAGEALGQKITLDDSPCILDAHVNENIVFVEVALGLNFEKIGLLEFKLRELMTLHSLEIPRFLVMLSSLDLKAQDLPKIRRLFEILVGLTRGRIKWVKVLTQSKAVEMALRGLWEFSELSITDSLEKAMEELLDKDKLESFLQDSKPVASSSLEMRFDNDKALADLSNRMRSEGADLRVAVVDDDFIVQEIVKNTFLPSGSTVLAFDDGGHFLKDAPQDLDLIFLDLMMPHVDGFGVMESLKAAGRQTPIIVLSALSQRDTVLRALSYGIRSYITKPLKPDDLLRKTFEVVGSHF
jgi:DNA-binding response OmpR family regulator